MSADVYETGNKNFAFLSRFKDCLKWDMEEGWLLAGTPTAAGYYIFINGARTFLTKETLTFVKAKIEDV